MSCSTCAARAAETPLQIDAYANAICDYVCADCGRVIATVACFDLGVAERAKEIPKGLGKAAQARAVEALFAAKARRLN